MQVRLPNKKKIRPPSPKILVPPLDAMMIYKELGIIIHQKELGVTISHLETIIVCLFRESKLLLLFFLFGVHEVEREGVGRRGSGWEFNFYCVKSLLSSS
jgi:hypothetical protein